MSTEVLRDDGVGFNLRFTCTWITNGKDEQ